MSLSYTKPEVKTHLQELEAKLQRKQAYTRAAMVAVFIAGFIGLGSLLINSL